MLQYAPLKEIPNNTGKTNLARALVSVRNERTKTRNASQIFASNREIEIEANRRMLQDRKVFQKTFPTDNFVLF